jgi:hypothetical protein
MNWNFDSDFSLANLPEFGDIHIAFLPVNGIKARAKSALRGQVL